VTTSVEHWRWHGRSISTMLAFEALQPGVDVALQAAPFAAKAVPEAGRSRRRSARQSIERELMKGSQKPKKPGKKQPQKTLKQRRAEKREVAKPGRAFDV
jgi:hypothetical protein